MLSRTLFRALPRTSTRIASRSAFRPTVASSIRQSRISAPPLRAAFSTTRARFDDASQELAAKLSSEMALESEPTESNVDSETNIAKFLEENEAWTLESPESQQDVVLRRQYDDELITVSFSIVDFNTASAVLPDEEADETYLDEEDVVEPARTGMGKGGAINQAHPGPGGLKMAPEDSIAPSDTEEMRDEDDYETQQAFPANVNVLIQRAGKGALRINLVADNGRFTIHAVTHLPENTAGATATDLLKNTPDSLYTGPPFQQLDEEVQSLLEQYLDNRGINTALALFIPDYIDVKEQKEYLGWLARVKDFVE